MVITIISSTEKGGAGYASKNLYQGLLDIGFEVNFLTIDDLYKEKKNILLRLYRWWLVRKNIIRNYKMMKGAPGGYDYFTFDQTGYQYIYNHPFVKNADVINIHWVSNMIDYPSFFKNINKPIIWTLHDTHPFTGGCHYTFGCDKYLTDCENCIQLGEKFKKFAAKDNLQIKHDALKSLVPKKTIVVSPSIWLKSLSEKSFLFKKYPHCYVPNGIDTNKFKKYDLIKSRKTMGLPLDKFIILFVSTSINEHRKGFDVILKLKDLLKDRNDIVFVSVGKVDETYEGIINLGYITDKNNIATAYNAANVFLIPSREDNLPNTILESLCCGTPVIGYKTGGILDAIAHGENGFLIDKEDVPSIVKYINEMIANPSFFNREDISNVARQKYNREDQALSYQKIIQERLMDKN